jgi:hypothetical protein
MITQIPRIIFEEKVSVEGEKNQTLAKQSLAVNFIFD